MPTPSTIEMTRPISTQAEPFTRRRRNDGGDAGVALPVALTARSRAGDPRDGERGRASEG